ncbi:Carboxyl-terminal protease [Candidatus Similichlamydia laticola]|uniref:Carboxyl-terminal protease n=2 Tax=Candidatus Similichlamydia laticola TaxID=2170265 RepID=A0A369KEI3_9BACT|nr:Carboxyl-terminal protease [Candidatus Similichlamydia laticola]
MKKVGSCLQLHATWHELSPELVERTLTTYFGYLSLSEDFFDQKIREQWGTPSSSLIATTLAQLREDRLTSFSQLVDLAKQKLLQLKEGTEAEQTQFRKIQAQHKNLIHGLLAVGENTSIVCTLFLKAFVSSLDSHSEYFTPDEFEQFMIEVQQETVGIGVVLEAVPDGARILEVIEGGPTHSTGLVLEQDIITHVNEKTIKGLPIDEIAKLLKGAENTSVTIRIQRHKDFNLDVTISRGKVVLQRKRLEVTQHAFGDGVIALIALHSFYASQDDSCSVELANTIQTLKAELGDSLKAIVLDLRRNSGGLLRQGIEVANLFLRAGVIVSIRDNSEATQLFRHFGEQTIWTGPLFVLVSRASASCAEIVAQSLQDYGRALVIGDDKTYGKGSFQMFISEDPKMVQTQGEIKLTRGMYYTASGKSPQGKGVQPHILVPGLTSQAPIGEEFSRFFLKADDIQPSFEDGLTDIPIGLRQRILPLYRQNAQPLYTLSEEAIRRMQKNSQDRILTNPGYQKALTKSTEQDESLRMFLSNSPSWKECDFQLVESLNVVKDYLYMDATSSGVPIWFPSK